MSFLRRSIDAVNREIQFEVEENANSINLKFDPSFSQPYIDAINVRVERVAKDSKNETLYSGTYEEIKKLLKFVFPTMGNILPFAIGNSLELTPDVKLLITLQFPQAMQESRQLDVKEPTSFEYELNTTLQTTRNPLAIKKVVVDAELSFSTEYYPLLLISKNVDSYETVVVVQNQVGNDVPRKVFLGKEMVKSQTKQGEDFLPMLTGKDQEVTVKGTSICYLLLIQP